MEYKFSALTARLRCLHSFALLFYSKLMLDFLFLFAVISTSEIGKETSWKPRKQQQYVLHMLFTELNLSNFSHMFGLYSGTPI